jgi:hypothetical protein
MIGNPLRHRWRNAVRLVHAAEIEMGDEQSDRRKMVVGALAEAISEPSEAPRGHAKRKVLAFG